MWRRKGALYLERRPSGLSLLFARRVGGDSLDEVHQCVNERRAFRPSVEPVLGLLLNVLEIDRLLKLRSDAEAVVQRYIQYGFVHCLENVHHAYAAWSWKSKHVRAHAIPECTAVIEANGLFVA
jgi:hypothetical protein